MCVCVFIIRIIHTTYRKLKKSRKIKERGRNCLSSHPLGEVNESTRRAFCEYHLFLFKEMLRRGFPGCLVVRIPGFHCYGPGSIPGQGTEILKALRYSQKKEKTEKKKKSQTPIHDTTRFKKLLNYNSNNY